MIRTYLLFAIVIFFIGCSKSSNNNEKKEKELTELTASYKGDFVSGVHPTSGKALVSKDKSELYFKEFKTTQGPIMEIWLATKIDIKDADETEYKNLGIMKGNDGDYKYDLLKNIDLSKYRYVLVWCVEFNVLFGYAVLSSN